jgi:tetratricopeptide (TPR) repeat protein
MSPQAASSQTTTPRLALIAIVALVIAGLTTLDKFLANAQDAEVQRLAERAYLEGVRLRRAGNLKDAIEAFRKAHALERRQPEYQLELIDALIAAGKLDRAEMLVNDLLDRAPNSGRANLLAARLMIAKGKAADAESYYHRAVYGQWPSDAAAHRIAARMELADFLAAKGKKEELLAELLPLQEEAGKDPAVERHLAQLFVVAGSPSHAADEYRALIEQNSQDAAAYMGLGQTELQLGKYWLAHEAFSAAAALKHDDPSIQRQLELSGTLMALDPTPRKLTSVERYDRSTRVLDLARSDLERCAAKNPALNSQETQQLLTSNALAGATNENAEQALSLAEKMWSARTKICGTTTSPDEEPLHLIMEKLAR